MHPAGGASELAGTPWGRRRAVAGAAVWLRTIRGHILIAFFVMSGITAALGMYAALSIASAGRLVTETFDKSLMSINYARAASADFGAMQAALVRRCIAANPDMQNKLDLKIEALAQSLTEDLAIAAERSQSPRAARAAANAQQAAGAWDDARRQCPRAGADGFWQALDQHAAVLDQQIELLVNYTAGDGFIYRQRARAAVAADQRVNLAGTGAALLLSALVAWLLARRIIGPVAAASAVAGQIAQGKLNGAIPRGGTDELGALLIAMVVMRDNIRAMMDRETAQHRSAQTRLADALESSREGVVVVDAQGHIALANSQAAPLLGAAPELLRPGVPFADLATCTTAKTDTGAALLRRLACNEVTTDEARLTDGRWVRVSQSATRDGGFVAVCSDITVLKSQEEKLKATNLRLDAALDNMSQGLCLYDAGHRLKVVNRRFCEIFCLSPAQVRLGISFLDVLELSVAAGNHPGRSAADLRVERADQVSKGAKVTQFFLELSQGRVVAIAHRPMPDGGWVATYEDITERRRAEAQIVHMARHDALTGLPNRVLFGERVEQALAQVGRDTSFAIFCLDLDRFKIVNDTLGHPIGDELLRAVAFRLQACVREVDTVARLGGDEFAIVQASLETPEDAAVLAQRIVETVSRPYDLDGHRVTIGTSVGISMAPLDGGSYSKLLKCSDMALYRVKLDGRGAWRFFEPEMDAQLQARRVLELDLRDALVHDQFEVFYQPIFDLAQDQVGGFEALLRWHHPTRGPVLPTEFVPLAEELGIIVPLGNWVLHTACAEAVSWPSHVKVAVNVSAAQFKSGCLAESVIDALARSGLPAGRLELEITESVLLAESAATLATLHAIRNLGVRISMDDFGTGYSSLSYLRSFPFDKIKIDRSFIRDLGTQDSSAIVRAITGLGRSLGMKTLAEGVETNEQLAWLRSEGCSEAQGYLFGPPKPASSVFLLLQQWDATQCAA